MNIDQYEKREMAMLAAAFGPTLIVLGTTTITGTMADTLIAALGALATTYAILTLNKCMEERHDTRNNTESNSETN